MIKTLTLKGLKQIEYTETEINYLIANYNSDKSIEDIANFLNKTKYSVIHKAQLLGLHRHPKRLSDTIKEHVIKMAKQNILTKKEISNQLKISQDSVSKICKETCINLKGNKRSTTNILLKDFIPKSSIHYHRRDLAYYRDAAIYAYQNTCWDCKQIFKTNELQAHHDFSKLPVMLVVLCHDCHLKRHNSKRRQKLNALV